MGVSLRDAFLVLAHICDKEDGQEWVDLMMDLMVRENWTYRSASEVRELLRTGAAVREMKSTSGL